MTRVIHPNPAVAPSASSPQETRARLAGVVTFHDDTKGFGMIQADGTEYFFHAKFCRGAGGGNTFRMLVEGTRVTFEPGETEKGLRAFVVRVDKEAMSQAHERQDARGNR